MSDDFRADYSRRRGRSRDEWPRLHDLAAPAATRRPRRLAPRRRRPTPGSCSRSPSYRELWRVQAVTELSRAEFADLGQGDAARARRRRELRHFGDPCARRRSSRSASRSRSPRRRTQPRRGRRRRRRRRRLELRPAAHADRRAATHDGRRGARRGRPCSPSVEPIGGRLAARARGRPRREPTSATRSIVHAQRRARDARRDGQRGARLRPRRAGRSSASRSRTSRSRTSSRPTRPASTSALEVRVNDVRWDEGRRSTTPGRATARTSSRTGRGGQATSSSATASAARGCRPARTTSARATARASAPAGNVKAGALAQLLDRPLGVEGRRATRQPRAGGVDPEPEAAARASIPLAVRTLGRAVSLLDYADFARAFAGVAKAHAAVLPLRAGRTVVVTVASRASGPEAAERLEDLGDAAARLRRPAGAGRRRRRRTRRRFRLALKVAVDPAYESDAVLAEVEAALRAAYSFEARGSSSRVYRSRDRGGRALGRRRGRGRRRPPLHRRARPASPTGCSPAQPAVGPGRRRDRRPGCSLLDASAARLAGGR